MNRKNHAISVDNEFPCQNQKYAVHVLLFVEFFRTLAATREEKETRRLFDTFRPQPGRARGSKEKFFIFLAGNPLKSPDSEK